MSDPRDISTLAILWAKGTAAKIKKLQGCDPKTRDRIVAGFIDGMVKREVPYPGQSNLPGIQPEFDAPYDAGYWAGRDFARAAEIVENNG